MMAWRIVPWLLLLASLPALAVEPRPPRPEDIAFPVSDWVAPSPEKARRQTPGGTPVYFQTQDLQRRIAVEVILRSADAPFPEFASAWSLLLAEGAPRGTDAAAFRKDLERAGARIVAGDRGGLPSLTLTAPPAGFEKPLDLFRSLLQAPAFTAPALDAVRDRLVSLRAITEREPGFLEARAWRRLAAGDPGPAGARQTALRPADLEAFHAAFVHPGRVLVAVAGPMTEAAAIAWARGTFDSLPPGKPAPTVAPGVPAGPLGVFVAPAPGPLVFVAAGFPCPGPGIKGPDPALCLAAAVVENRVLETMRKAFKTPPLLFEHCERNPWRYEGSRFGFALPPRQALEALKAILDEASGLASDLPRQEELWAAQGSLLQAPLLHLAEGKDTAGFFAAAEAHWGAPMSDAFLREGFLGIANEEIAEAARRWLSPGRFLAVVSGPVKEIEEELGRLKFGEMGVAVVKTASLSADD